MKKIFVIAGSLILLYLQSFSQTSSSQHNRVPSMQSLIGRWEIVGTKEDGGRLEIVDSSTIVITYGGEKKALSGFQLDFSKSPIWFDFFVKDSSATMTVKSIMEVISDDLIKWQVFMNDDRMDHFTSEKGELFYLKRIKIKSVTTFAPQWDKKKLHRFEELKSFSNVLQYPQDIKGNWEKFFQNDHPLILELACGKGEYALGLGQIHPEQNFIGVDLKGNRIWVGAKKALQNQLSNVAFLRIEIDQIPDYFAPDEVSEIWITFPDPQPRTGKAKKRLTHPKFLRLYGQILKKNALIHLKTDSPGLYNFTKLVAERYGCKLITDINDINNIQELPDELKIKTHYESLDIAQSSRVHYLKFSLPEKLPGKEIDKELQQFLKENEPGTIN